MGKKLIPIVLLLIIIAVGAVAYKFYDEKGKLTMRVSALEEEQQRLTQENQSLQQRLTNTESAYRDSENRYDQIKDELSRVESDRNNLKSQISSLRADRDRLADELAKKPKVQVIEKKAEAEAAAPQAPAGSMDYWADFVRAKAELAVQLEDLSGKLKELNAAMAEKESKNKELMVQIDGLEKRKKKLEAEVDFKKRTLDIVSRELVNERETRKALTDETIEMRKSNVELKRDLVMANKEKLQLQKNIDDLAAKRDTLEKRIAEVETIMKEKSMALSELEEGLSQALHPDSVMLDKKTASVELPPIVVKPDKAALKGMRGEVIAVNDKEKFVIVNLGEASGIRPGFQMKVMRGDKNIGLIEVIETRREISAADIKDVTGGESIQEGDIAITK